MKNLILVFCCMLGFFLAKSQDISVMTYNIRLDLDSDGENAWSNRKDMLISQIKSKLPDIIGMQEGLPHQIEYLNKLLPGHTSVGLPRDDGKTKGEYSNIFYNTQKFKLISHRTFWLSQTPNRPSKGWDAAYNRICTYALFESSDSKNRFWVFNTHFDHKGKQAQSKSAGLIKKVIRKVNRKKYPVILMGDLNLTPETKIIKNLTKKYKDTYVEKFAPNQTTFNSFTSSTGPRIDYILTSEKIIVHKYSILAEKIQGHFPSDHFPVLVTISL